MGIDRTGAGTDKPAEATEEPPPPDRRPPPDRPGAEGAPSRADSRNGAAAANDTSTQATDKPGEEKPDTVQASQETSGEQDSTAAEDKPEMPGTSEVNESSSNDNGISGGRHETGPGEADTGGTPETEQRSEETRDADGREQALDSQATSQDNTWVTPGSLET
jgi:hypothetical protein